MKTPLALTAALFTTLMPALAFAGGPPGDSPEPSSAMLLLLGAAPLVLFAGYQLLSRRREAVRVGADRA